jgi:mono/diheme cytochrome c family protein
MALAQEQDAEQYFNAHCKACHTIGGGPILGPDLKGVLDRQSREWLVEFIVDPDSKLDSDPYAQEMLAATPGGAVRMISIPSMTPLIANSLLDYIVAKSGGDAGPVAPTEELLPFTAEQRELGMKYFTGEEPFRAGAPSCSSCHTTAGLGAWGGGALGPDLTQVMSRLGGRVGLTGWLATPASLTMQPVFKDHKLIPEEIDALVAFLESESENTEDAPSVTASFLGVGVIVAIAILALFGFLWKDRYTATRIPLVEKSKR